MIPLVDAIPPVRGRRGRPRRRPDKLYGDRAYHSREGRKELRCRGIQARIAWPKRPHGSGLGTRRWVVERTIAWLHQYRRLRVRHERRDDIHEAFLAIGCSLILPQAPRLCATCVVTLATMSASSLTPMLTVKNAAAAIEFYRDAFDAVEQARFTAPTGHVVAEMAIDGLRFLVVDENPEAFNLSPISLDGTTVRINLIVDDPDAAAAQAIRAGASEIFPVADQPYGLRQGRIADPDGHHWLIGKPLDD
jgi:PhnB protein